MRSTAPPLPSPLLFGGKEKSPRGKKGKALGYKPLKLLPARYRKKEGGVSKGEKRKIGDSPPSCTRELEGRDQERKKKREKASLVIASPLGSRDNWKRGERMKAVMLTINGGKKKKKTRGGGNEGRFSLSVILYCHERKGGKNLLKEGKGGEKNGVVVILPSLDTLLLGVKREKGRGSRLFPPFWRKEEEKGEVFLI